MWLFVTCNENWELTQNTKWWLKALMSILPIECDGVLLLPGRKRWLRGSPSWEKKTYGVTAVDTCIPLHIVTCHDSNRNKVCVHACTRHPRVGRKQTSYWSWRIDLTSHLSLQQAEFLSESEFAHRWVWRWRRCRFCPARTNRLHKEESVWCWVSHWSEVQETERKK